MQGEGEEEGGEGDYFGDGHGEEEGAQVEGDGQVDEAGEVDGQGVRLVHAGRSGAG